MEVLSNESHPAEASVVQARFHTQGTGHCVQWCIPWMARPTEQPGCGVLIALPGHPVCVGMASLDCTCFPCPVYFSRTSRWYYAHGCMVCKPLNLSLN